MLLSSLSTACSETPGPSAAAINAYVEREAGPDPGVRAGTPTVVAANAGGATGTDEVTKEPVIPAAPQTVPRAPVARRVQVTIERGVDLYDSDSGPGETDAYVVLDYEGHRFESSVVEGELNPVWGDSFVFDVRPGGVLTVSLLDEDTLASDDKLGIVSQPIEALSIGESQELWLSFRGGEMGKVLLTITGIRRDAPKDRRR